MQYSETGRIQRPWGEYTVLSKWPGYQVKKLTINPGQQFSYQSHEHRDEYWVIVQGTGLLRENDKFSQKTVGDMIEIPKGMKHRMKNVGDLELIIIETQIGDYLEEDDITRYADDYGRHEQIN